MEVLYTTATFLYVYDYLKNKVMSVKTKAKQNKNWGVTQVWGLKALLTPPRPGGPGGPAGPGGPGSPGCPGMPSCPGGPAGPWTKRGWGYYKYKPEPHPLQFPSSLRMQCLPLGLEGHGLPLVPAGLRVKKRETD